MNKILIPAVIVVIIIGVAVLIVATRGQNTNPETDMSVFSESMSDTDKSSPDSMTDENAQMDDEDKVESMADDQEESTDMKTYTLDQIAEHSSAGDCWLAIDGSVYDVTPFIKSGSHPGGVAILQGCGTDATELYNDRPNGSGAHSERARSFLPDYLIGTVAE